MENTAATPHSASLHHLNIQLDTIISTISTCSGPRELRGCGSWCGTGHCGARSRGAGARFINIGGWTINQTQQRGQTAQHRTAGRRPDAVDSGHQHKYAILTLLTNNGLIHPVQRNFTATTKILCCRFQHITTNTWHRLVDTRNHS